MMIRRFVFVPLLLSFPVSVVVSVVALIVSWAGWRPASLRWIELQTVADALAVYPAYFAISVILGWVVFGIGLLVVPLSPARPIE